jgi:LEA14-like dessication related protein
VRRLIPVLLLFPVLFSACSLFKAPKFERVHEVQLKELTPDHSNLDLSIVISNPNWFTISVKNLSVEIMDKTRDRMGTVTMTQPMAMKKHSADTVYFEIQMDTRKVANLISHSSQKVEFIVRAQAVAKVFGITKKVTTRILEEMLPKIPSDIAIPTIKANAGKSAAKSGKTVVRDPSFKTAGSSPTKPDIFKIIKTSVTDFGLKETELTVRFMMLNPYGLSFTFRDFPSEIWINDKYAGRGKLAKPVIFDENIFNADGELVFTLNNFNSVLLASKALVKKDMNYQVNGTIMVDGFGTSISKPFRFTGTVEIGKKDK